MMKSIKKFTKILLLIAMIFSDLMTPIKVLANEAAKVVPSKGDIGINGTISDSDSAVVSLGGLANEGDVQVTKTVSPSKDKDGNVIDGRYKIEFNIKGKDIEDTEEVTKPVYVVVVFDTSGSMQNYCIGNILGTNKDMGTAENCGALGSFYTLYPKWKNSVAGAKTFSSILLTKIPEAQIALVTFASTTSATSARGFESSVLEDDDFGTPNGATNLHAGLLKANVLLSSDSIPDNANKYIVVISDGQPTYYLTNSNDYNSYAGPGNSTSKDVLDATYDTANSIKNSGTEIFTLGYDLEDDSFNVTGYGELTTETILKNIASTDTVEDKKNNITHYLNADPNAIATAFTNIATSISYTPAGTNATLTDNIGSKFKIVGKSGNVFTSDTISQITEEGTTISFEVEIDESKVTSDSWYNTNEGFSLTYTDANGEEQTISTNQNPQVYWTPTVYEYTVNYYKDSISGSPIASEKFEATNGTVISSVDQDKYLNNSSLGTVGYEFNSVSNMPVTISDNSTVINVLYTIKKFSYDVNYYYDGELDEELSNTIEAVSYGTVVNANSLYSAGEREGYSLVTGTSTSGDVVIDKDNIEINIFYTKNSYEYNINYHFNGETGFSKNDTAIFGSVIKAEDNYLSDSELEENDKEDYFISPVRPSNPSQITVGTNKDNNVINIYYVSTVVTDESIDKTANKDKITSGDTPVTYTVDYTSVVNNVNKGDTVRVVVTDILPLEIDESKSNLNGGIYNKESKTITWTIENTMAEFMEEYDASKTISYTVVYKNVGNGDGSVLVNRVVGSTTAGGKTTTEKGDSATVKVEIPGKVTVYHYLDGTTTSVADDVILNGLVGETYQTSPVTVFGYSLNSDKMPSNANGTYTEEDIVVTYYYTKNDGVVENTEVVKSSTDSDKVIDSIDGVFEYTITSSGEVSDYVGDITVEVIDKVPYALTEEAINNLSNECEYDSANKTIICRRVITITEEDYTNGVYNINEVFELELTFVGVDSKVVTNNAKVTIKLDSNVKEEDIDTEDVTVKEGNVIVHHYIDGTTTSLVSDEELKGLVGSKYSTSSKEVFGYAVNSDKIPSNASGTYTKEDIVVNYYYIKNEGTVENTDVVKKSTNDGKIVDSVDGVFEYEITASGEVSDYVGDITIEVVDTVPYGLTEEAINNLSNECVYDSTNKTITCRRVVTISEEDYTDCVYIVNEVFSLSLIFADIDSNVVTNNAKVTIKLDSNVKEEDTDTEDVTVEEGNVIVTYKDKDGNRLHEDITKGPELAGTSYDTEIKEFYGYSLVEVPSNKEGKYLANQTITVNYVYTKNDGTVTNNSVVKKGPDSISRIDDTVNYSFEYKADITGYTGDVTLTITDTLPYGAVIVSVDNSCRYNDGVIVCQKEYDINSDTTINEVFNVALKYTNISFDDINVSTEFTNEVVAELTYGDNKVTNTASCDTVVSTGDVIVTYKDTEGNILHNNITISGLSGEEYATEEKTFFGYSLTETPNNSEGEFATNQTINVDYVYSKNDGSVDNTDIVKSSTDSDKVIDSIGSKFGYTISATGEVKDYVGDVTVKVVDKLPYEIDIEKSNIGSCTYDKDSKTITCVKEYTISEEDYIDGVYTINEIIELELVFIDVDSDTVVNAATVEIKLEDSKVTGKEETDEEVEVVKGMVTATYEDTEGNELHKAVVSEGLVGSEYTTENKEFFGYTITEVPENKEGIFTKEDITVNYVYSKNNGSVDNTDIVKSSTDSDKVIDSIDGVFGYTITASGEVRDYVGDVTVKVIDKLPYEIDTEKSNIGSCTYDKDSKTITCEKEYTISEGDYTDGVYAIDETISLELVFIGIASDTVVNEATVEIKLEDSKVTGEDETDEEVEIAKGNVVVTYKDTKGNKLHEDVVMGPELAGTSYTTEEKTFFGYTITEVPSNKEGKYLANQTINVNYVYSKNDGSVDNTDIVKMATDSDKVIDSIDGVFGYTITASGEVRDYVGDVTVKVIDKLPYEIDTEKSNIGSCTYDKDSKTITCEKEYTISEEDYTDGVYTIKEIIDLELVFIGIDSETVVNDASIEIVLEDSKVTGKDETDEEVTVEKGSVIVTYKDTEGNKLHEDITIGPELAGTKYTTENKEFYGYTIVSVPTNANGVYTKEDITVNYVYSKNIGTSSEEFVKEGNLEISSIDSGFEYTIKYNTVISDYVGEATLVITDELPYEIDTEKSIYNKETCDYTDGKLVCTYTKNISKEDNSFDVEEVFTLYYVNIVDSKVTNKATAELTYSTTTKNNDSEYTSEIKTSTVTVNYVTKDGKKLDDSIILTGMVGELYKTEKRTFDKYHFIEVRGEKEGEYTEENKEVTFVYDLTPLPPQTGVEINMFMYVKYLVCFAIILVSSRTYKVIRND